MSCFIITSHALRGMAWGGLTAVLLLASAPAVAQQIDLSLNLLYNNPGNPNSSGTWQLVGKSSHSGILSVNTFLTGVNAPVANVAPRGRVNEDPCTGGISLGCAGFYISDHAIHAGYLELVVSQSQLFPSGSDEEAIFYGVGTLTNGSPNYPGKPGGTNSIGPNMTTLTNVSGVPWATGDVFSNAAWNTAAILAAGSFSAGSTPGFFGGLDSIGSVFTSVGTVSTAGAFSDFESTIITEIVRTNLMVGGNDGDYNNDGIVNAADYVFWRDSLGKSVTAFAEADGDGSGTIDQPDYDHWVNNFGNMPGSAANAGQALAVPEPSTFLLGLLTVGILAVKFQMNRIHGKSAAGR